jgi:hypothetical protein
MDKHPSPGIDRFDYLAAAFVLAAGKKSRSEFSLP